MKRLKWCMAVLIIALALVPAACSGGAEQPPESVTVEGEGAYTLTLSESEINGFTDTETYLPVPTAKDGAGTDISDSVEVSVRYADGRVYSPEHRYSLYNAFVANEAGEYIASYSVEDGQGRTMARAYAKINVAEEQPEDAGIVIDGVLDDATYSGMPAYKTGINGNLNFKYHFGKDGMYIGADVKDTQLIYSDYVVSRFTQSDGFEIYLNLSDEEGDLLNDRCFKIQVNVNGLVRIFGASEGKVVYEINERISPDYKLQVHGTRTKVSGESDLSYYDKDTGYTFEAYFPYAQLGIESVPDAIGVAFSHRDVSSANPSLINDGAQANQCFNDIDLPDNVTQIILDNGRTYEVETYETYSITALYNTLYLNGEHKGVAAPQGTYSVEVDGVAESAWENAEMFAVGENKAAVKAFIDDSGLYVFVEVEDDTLAAGTNGSIYGGDCVQLRIASGETLESDALPKGMRKGDRIVTVAADSRSEKSYLNDDALLFVGGFDAAYAVAETDTGYAVEFFIPAYALGSVADPVGICVGVIDGDGQTGTTVSDFIYSSACDIPSEYRIIGG